MEMFSLEGKTALITGGSRGIGFAIARSFLNAGARVVITGRTQEKLDDAVGQLGENALALRCDQGDTEQVMAMVDDAWRAGPIDILVNNAGNGEFYKRAEYVTPEEFDEVVSVNVRGLYFCTTEVAKRMFADERPGSIINNSSMSGITPLERLGVYSASKAAVHQLTRVMALEWAPKNVRVNCIAPGWTDTEFVSELFASRWGEKLTQDVPMGRLATADEIAGAALYFASDASAYVTGTILPIDGGRGLR